MDHFIKLYKKKKGKDIRKDNRAVQKLRREVEKAKRALSASHQVCIRSFLFYISYFSHDPCIFKFSNIVSVQVKRLLRICCLIDFIYIIFFF